MADDASAARPMVGKIRGEQDHADLLTYHMAVIRQAKAKVETAQGPVDEAKADLASANEELTKAFNAAKGDLGRHYSRKYLEALELDGREKTTTLVERENIRARDKAILSQPVYGVQPELFPGAETPTAARDEMAWRNEGVLRGLRGALEELQPGDPPEFHQVIMAGYVEGQEITQQRFLRAQELRRAESQPNAGAAPVNLDPPEPGSEAHELAEKAAIGRARESLEAMGKAGPDAGGEPGADSDGNPDEGGGAPDGAAEGAQQAETGDVAADGFAASEAEISQQAPRRAVKDAKAGRTSGAAEAVH
jgi:hypothetical protein